MGETRNIGAKTIKYNGVFRTDELCKLIRRFANEREYYPEETLSQEDILPQGKQIILNWDLNRTLNQYSKGTISLNIVMSGLQDTVVKLGEHDQKVQQGSVEINLKAKLETDYRTEFEDTGLKFLFRTISDKFIRRGELSKIKGEIKKALEDLSMEMKNYLNMHRFKLSESPQDPAA